MSRGEGGAPENPGRRGGGRLSRLLAVIGDVTGTDQLFKKAAVRFLTSVHRDVYESTPPLPQRSYI